jgi:MYXO-CTERM domain-containing protein
MDFPLNNTYMKKTIALGMLASFGLLSVSSATTLFGVTTDNKLVSFDISAPSVFQTSASITGLFDADGVTPNPNGTLLNLTARPTTPGSFQLYGIDSHANVYTLSLGGAATLISSSFSPSGFSSGLAYDVLNDNLVYAGDNAENFTLSLAGSATANPNFTYAGGGSPEIFGLGIDPLLGTAYAIDAFNDSLSTSSEISFPSSSELNIVGGLGIDVTSFGGLVVDYDGNLLASLSTDGLSSSLYSIDATTGVATSLGSFGAGVGMSSIAVPEPSAVLLGSLGLLALLRRRRN